MTYYPDLARCDYWGLPPEENRLRAVGWLHPGHPVPRRGPQATDAPDLVERLADALENTYEHGRFAGYHACSFCPASPSTWGPTRHVQDGRTLTLGCANLFLPWPGEPLLLVAPSLVLHYVAAHAYALPEVFVAALQERPQVGSPEYLLRVTELWPRAWREGLVWHLAAGAEGYAPLPEAHAGLLEHVNATLETPESSSSLEAALKVCVGWGSAAASLLPTLEAARDRARQGGSESGPRKLDFEAAIRALEGPPPTS